MKIKELKEKINKIDEEYDDFEVVVRNPDYNEYCLGSCCVKVTDTEFFARSYYDENNLQYFIGFDVD